MPKREFPMTCILDVIGLAESTFLHLQYATPPLLHCIIVTFEQVHEIVDAAHKKLVLACLLSHNDDLSCLKHLSVPRTQPYDSLVSAFSTCKDKGKASLNALRNTIGRFQEVFEMDGNIELVMRLQDAYLLQAILAQSRTHVAVNALQLCSDLNLPSSVKIPDCIQALISQAFCFAQLVCICFLPLAGQVEGHTPRHETHFCARSRYLYPHFLPLPSFNPHFYLSSDGNTEQRLRSLSAHATTLEQLLQNELRLSEVT